MQTFPITVTPPVAPDKKLQATYQQLAGDAAALADKRRSAMSRWKDLAAKKNSVRTADAVPLTVEMLELEIGVLEAEVPVLKRVPEYLQAALALRQREVAIARETVPLAEAHVTAIFHRDFDPQRWPIRPAVLN